MPRLVAVFAACLSIILSNKPATAQSRNIVSLCGGISIPLKPDLFNDYWGAGYSIGAGYGHFLNARQTVALQTWLNYSSHPLDEDELLKAVGGVGSDVSISGGSADILTIAVNLKVSTGSVDSKAVPYLTAGAGLFRLSASDATFVGSGQTISQEFGEAEHKIGLSFGAGLNLNLTDRSGIFVEAKYEIGLTEDETTQYIPLRIGVFFR